jgi:hypothetical protein
MNPRIGTLFKLCAGACIVLISFTAYWQIWAASGLAARQDNARLVYRQLQIKRGLILAPTATRCWPPTPSTRRTA